MATASCVWWRGCQLSRIRGTNTPSRRRGGSSLRHPTPMWSTSNTCRGCTRAMRSWRGRRGKGSGRTRRPLATIRSLPRDARLWHHQVGKTRPQAETLRWLRQNQKGEVHESVDLRNLVGDTTIIGWPACSDGPWRRRGGALTLPVFFLRFGSPFSAQELLLYHLNGPKVIRTRDHPWGSKEARAAAWARMEAYGHWGHRSRSKGRTGQ